MANQGAKKRKEENLRHMAKLRNLIIAANQQLPSMAKPAYGDDGKLFDGGFDMSTDGICGYLHDVVYITAFVQVMSIISDKFWYTYLVIPAYGAYQSFGFIKGFLSQGSEGGVEDEKTRKKREKMEKRASRDKFVRKRTR